MISHNKKITVGILFGGKSAEHEVSLQSAKNVYDAIDRARFEPALIGIDKNGKWHFMGDSLSLLNSDDPRRISLASAGPNGAGPGGLVALMPESSSLLSGTGSNGQGPKLDVVFPILHGPFGEDGTVQGLLKLADVPFVGSGVLGSAVSMDKDVMKRLFRDADIPIGKFLACVSSKRPPSFAEINEALGVPFFVKPANMGSSVGINKVKNEEGYANAIKEAFQYDAKIIIEEFIPGREIECAVLGNENPIASICGEIIPTHEYYSYDAKYIDDNGAKLVIPAQIDLECQKRIQELSVKAFQTLCCSGLARVDFFLREDNAGGPEVIINEINTMPGFTKISMYPKLWEASGIGYTELISRLIDLAMENSCRPQ